MRNAPNIGFIGSGNMARAILNGLIRNNFPPHALWASDPDSTQLDAVSESTEIHRTSNNEELVENCSFLIFAVKPQTLRSVLSPLQEAIAKHRPLIVSLAAGIPLHSLYLWSGKHSKIIRTMPNTPSQIGLGVTALCAHPEVSEADLQSCETIFRAVGTTYRVKDEEEINLVTAISGSGPAYFFLFFEALENAACQLGMERHAARELILQTALGSSTLAQMSQLPPQLLREQVTSKGGTTEKALNQFEAGGFSQLVLDALTAAQRRSAQLSEQYGEEQ
jgi:pyrroline-5-carboxylate reductase